MEIETPYFIGRRLLRREADSVHYQRFEASQRLGGTNAVRVQNIQHSKNCVWRCSSPCLQLSPHQRETKCAFVADLIAVENFKFIPRSQTGPGIYKDLLYKIGCPSVPSFRRSTRDFNAATAPVAESIPSVAWSEDKIEILTF
ncbi:hypothetical protein CWB41_04935 [Methylovirgula ligni]|nr:hypothetical protein CWB41_04935 [Methylovirgula ligni]